VQENRTGDDDLFTLVMIGIGSIGAIAGGAWGLLGGAWAQAVGWLLAHDILVAGSTDPLLTMPAADGAGLDLSRLAIAAGAALLLLVAGIDALRRRRRDPFGELR
jgi:hypothetical protein